MQLLCRSYEGSSDVCCPVCGQGFQLYWTRQSPVDHTGLLSGVVDALGRQHVSHGTAEAHDMAEAHNSAGSFMSGIKLPIAPARRGGEPAWGYC